VSHNKEAKSGAQESGATWDHERWSSLEDGKRRLWLICPGCRQKVANLYYYYVAPRLVGPIGVIVQGLPPLCVSGAELRQHTLTVPRTKNGAARHVPLNKAATGALEALRAQTNGSELVCGGAREPRGWFEGAVREVGLSDFSRHCNRHTFASRLFMAGVDSRTIQELLGHKTIAMTVRYAHLAPKYTLAAVERLDAPTKKSN
jgi:hypothetical protein